MKQIFKKIITKCQNIFKNIVESLKKLIRKLLKKDKWKIYLYYKGQCIKKVYVDDDFKPMENFYIVKVKNLKHLIGTNRKTKLMLQYYKYKMTNNEKKEVHIETLIFEGSDLTL